MEHFRRKAFRLSGGRLRKIIHDFQHTKGPCQVAYRRAALRMRLSELRQSVCVLNQLQEPRQNPFGGKTVCLQREGLWQKVYGIFVPLQAPGSPSNHWREEPWMQLLQAKVQVGENFARAPGGQARGSGLPWRHPSFRLGTGGLGLAQLAPFFWGQNGTPSFTFYLPVNLT